MEDTHGFQFNGVKFKGEMDGNEDKSFYSGEGDEPGGRNQMEDGLPQQVTWKVPSDREIVRDNTPQNIDGPERQILDVETTVVDVKSISHTVHLVSSLINTITRTTVEAGTNAGPTTGENEAVVPLNICGQVINANR